MAFTRSFKKQSGGGGDLIPKTWAKFAGYGIDLPWSINSDYKVEVVYNQPNYLHFEVVIGNTSTTSDKLSYFCNYSNNLWANTGNGTESSFGVWSSGEHTFITNNENNKNVYDGTEVQNYIPYNSSAKYTIGKRLNAVTINGTYIKSYRIYSKSSGNLLHEIKPYLYRGDYIDFTTGKIVTNGEIPIMYDSISDTFFTAQNMTVTDDTPT